MGLVRSGRKSDRVSNTLKSVHSSQKSILPFFCSLLLNFYMTDFEKVTDFSNLYKAYKKAKCGKHYRASSAKFQIRCLDGINRLKKLLECKEYKVSPYQEKYVYEPKKRLIMISSFQDNVVQHSLCDNVLIPRLEQEFIETNFAGRVGKGTSYGLDILKKHMAAFYNENAMNGYILKADVTKFYYTIDHTYMKSLLRNYFDDENILWLCDVIIDSTADPGLPLGNQTSQVFALLYLNELDHLITDTMKILYYGRYADDFYILHKDKEVLKTCLQLISEHLWGMKLTLNGKTQIMPFKQGIKFLGFHTYIQNGEVICRLSNDKKRNAYRKYTKMAKRVVEGKTRPEKLKESFQSFKAHASQGDCQELIEDLENKINEILHFSLRNERGHNV